MPHVTVKLYPGRAEDQKMDLVARIVSGVVETLGTKEETVSVSIVEVAKEDWQEKVYIPEIAGARDTLYKAPGDKL